MYESVISFTLDTICPWTYLAKRRLDLALKQVEADPSIASKVRFTVEFRPYQLYPTFPGPPGVNRHEWLRDAKHGGSEEKMTMYSDLMRAYGAPLGIDFRFTGPIANTLAAHRVLQYVQETAGPVAAGKLVDALYVRYFEQEQSPSSAETLIAACLDAGIAESEAKILVEDESEHLAETKAAIREQAGNGVDSVPYVMFEGRKRDITLVGAKEVEEYVKALLTIAKESS